MRNALRVLSILAIVVGVVGLVLFFGFGSQNNLTQGGGALALGVGFLIAVAAAVVGAVTASRRSQTGWLVGFIVAAVLSLPFSPTYVLGPIVVGVVGLIYTFRLREA
jgi:threonine/homoserine efflux transporter RhtA